MSGENQNAPDAPKSDALIPSNAMNALNNKKEKIPGDVVYMATQNLPDNQRGAIRRFHAHYVKNDLSLDDTGKLVRLSGGTLSLVFRGKYPADLAAIVANIETFFELEDKRSQSRKLPFIKTKLTERIWNVCHSAREFQRIAFIFGDWQIGKSEALEAYTSEFNHGNTKYVAMPTGGALIHFLTKLAEQLDISPQQRLPILRRRIIKSFDDRMLLIVDEAHQCLESTGRKNGSSALQTIEFIRELFNERKCGVVICATNKFKDAMEEGETQRMLGQTKRRRLCALQLPNVPTQEDLNTFAKAYGLPPSSGAARDLEKRLVETEALGMWLTLLRVGKKLAGKNKMEWAHVISAYAGLKELEGGVK